MGFNIFKRAGSSSEIPDAVSERAPIILAEIKKANKILMNLHPSPDPDCVGSVLAMKAVLEKMGKEVTVLAGDSTTPKAFMHFPGAQNIVRRKFFEEDLSKYDLCILLDAATPANVSRLNTPSFPLPIKSIVIDHHETNDGYGDINLIVPDYPATGQLLYDIFNEWGIEIDSDVADNLFIAIYSDTIGFQTPFTTAKTFQVAAELAKKSRGISALISKTENTNSPQFMYFQAMALGSIKTFLNGEIAIASVSAQELIDKHIPIEEAKAGMISPLMRTVEDWKIVVAIIEATPGKLRMSFRSRDMNKYDVTKLAGIFNGGGHKEAAGATADMSIIDAIKIVVEKCEELYNL